MPKENKGASPPAEEATGDVSSGNITAQAATNKLFQGYLAAEKAKVEATKPKDEADVPPPEKGDQAAPSDSETTEPPVTEEKADAAKEGDAQAEPEKEAPAGTEEDGDVPSQPSHSLTPEEKAQFDALLEKAGWQQSVNKRVGDFKAKLRAAEIAREELETRLQQQSKEAEKAPEKVVVTAPTPDSPLADVNDIAGLQERFKTASQVIDEAQAIIDRLEESGEASVKVGESTWTKASLRDIRRQAERDIREHIPARHQFLSHRAHAAELIKADFPDLLNKSSPMYQEAQAAKLMYPQLAYLPNGDYLIGLALKGARAIAAEKSAAKNGKAPEVKTRQRPPQAVVAGGGTAGGTSRTPQNGAAALEAEKRAVVAKGNVSAAQMTEFLKKRELLNSHRNG